MLFRSRFASPWLGEALRFIRINISRNITAAEVCSAVGLSHAAVGAAFRRELGRSVQDEIKAVRMEESERLLRSTTLSVRDVAMRSGFGSASYFCSLFRFAHGVSPAQWRENATAKERLSSRKRNGASLQANRKTRSYMME